MCQYEHQLFDHFFPGADPEESSLAPLMDPLATILYDALRPQFIHIHALDELCEIVDILTHEVIASSALITQVSKTTQKMTTGTIWKPVWYVKVGWTPLITFTPVWTCLICIHL